MEKAATFRTFMRLCVVAATLMAAAPVTANPTGGVVVNGAASFQTSGNTLTVTNTPGAIINWQSFGIAANEVTRFVQQSASSAVLNRVTGGDPSAILGQLQSNGRVYLVNPNGIVFGQNAVIDTAGLIASTLNLSNQDFLANRLKFEDLANNAEILNQGFIHTSNEGEVVLVAPTINNEGVIDVEQGKLVLAAGQSVTISSLNYDNIEFEVQAPDNAVVNLGELMSDGGSIGVFAGSITNRGAISANAISVDEAGNIRLVAQADNVQTSANVSATSKTGKGGHIEILGDRVGLFGETRVDASGQTSGGEVLVGGDYQGSGDTPAASTTQVSQHSSIKADAIESGDGGKVIIWSDDFTLFYGSASATGGAVSGDGGFIEISGKGNLGFYGFASASSAFGSPGDILFDPIDITIALGGLTTITNPVNFIDNPGQSLTIDPSAITSILNQGTPVTLQADRVITVTDAIITAANGAGGSLTMQAGESIIINANIVTDNGRLSLTANDIGADLNNRGLGKANIQMADGVTIDTGTGNIEMTIDMGNGSGTSGDMLLATLKAQDIILRQHGLTAGSSIFRTATGSITANSVFIDHDGAVDGQVGSVTTPLNIITDFLGAHIHAPTTFGIFIDAAPNLSPNLVVGQTCYGQGSLGCGTFGTHIIGGLETVDGGGNIVLNVTGDLNVFEPIRTDDVAATGNPGDITLTVSGNTTSFSDIFNNITGGRVTVNSANPILLTAGNYKGIFSNPGAGGFDVNGNVGFDAVTFDNAMLSVSTGFLNLNATLDLINGAVLSNSNDVNIVGDFDIANSVGAATVDNFGRITKTAGAGVTTIAAVFNMNPGATLGIDSGTLSLAGAPLNLARGAELHGNGTFSGDVISTGGIIGPETSTGAIGTLTILGNLILDADSTLVFDIAGTVQGTSYDFLNVSGSVLQDGIIAMFWANNFTANSGASFDILQSGAGFNGVFRNELVPVGVTAFSSNTATPGVLQYVFTTVAPNILFWTNVNNGFFDVASNWSTGVAPVAGDYVVIQDIGANASQTVTIRNAESVAGIQSDAILEITGSGQLTIDGGGDSAIVGDLFNLNTTAGLVLNGATTNLVLASNAVWQSGTISGNGSIFHHPISTLTLSGGPQFIFDGVNFINHGIVNITTLNGELQLNNGARFTNNFFYTSPSRPTRIITATGPGTGFFDNNNIVSIGVDATLEINTEFNNASGSINFGANAGLLLITGGTFSGVVTVNGFVQNDSGLVRPGGAGIVGSMFINGGFTQASTGQLEIDITDTTAFDKLNVTGAATLDGELILKPSNAGYVPVDGDAITPLSASGGIFGNFLLVTNNVPGTSETVTINANDVSVLFNLLNAAILFDGGPGGTGTAWTVAANWAGDMLPTSTDDVVIGAGFNVDISGTADALSITLDASSSLTLSTGTLTIAGNSVLDGTFNINGGNLTGNGNVTLNGDLNWTGGSLSGLGSLITNSITNTINSTVTLSMSRNWINNGTITWTGGNLSVSGGKSWINSGNFDVNGGGLLTVNSGNTFDNQGNYNVIQSHAVSGNGAFDNSGVIALTAAQTLSLSVAGTDSGTWSLGTGSVDLLSGNRLLMDGFAITATAGTLNIAGGTFDVATTTALTLPSAVTTNLSAGNITGSGDLELFGNFNWSGGSLTGTGFLSTFSATATINSGVALTMARNWNSSSLAWTGGDLTITGGVFWTNSGNFDVNGGGTLTVNSGNIFLNQANYNVILSHGVSGNGNFNNSGIITISGTESLALNVSGTDSGSWSLGTGSVSLGSGIRSIFDGFSATATGGFLTISGGTLNVATSSPLILPATISTTLSSGNITGSGDLVLMGPLVWSGGGISGTGLLTTNSTGNNITAGVTLTLSRNWNNAGDISMMSGGMSITGGVTLTNTGNFNMTSTGAITINAGNVFDNQSNYDVGSNHTISGNGNFNNSGAISITGNRTFTLAASGSDSGTWNINTGTITLANGVRTINAGAVISSTSGILDINGGTFNVATTSPFSLPLTLTTNLNSGSINGSGDLAINGPFNWSGGGISGAGLLTTNSSNTTISSVASLSLSRNWINTGNIAWVAGNLSLTGSIQLINAGVFDANGGGALTINSTNLFQNQGSLLISQNTTINGNGSFNQTSGFTVLSSAALTTNSYTLNGGVLEGTGAINGNIVNSGATVSPGGAGIGILTINGTYTQGGGGTLNIDVNDTGTQPGIDYDQLVVNDASPSAASLNGVLNVTLLASAPPAGISLLVTPNGGVSGVFAIENVDPVFNAPVYNANSVDLLLSSGLLISWTGAAGDNNWSTAANWDLGLPTSADNVDITFSGTPINITLSTVEAVNGFTLNGATLTVASGGNLTLGGIASLDSASTLTLNGGNLTANGAFNSTGTVNVNGGSTVTFNNTASFNNLNVIGATVVLNGLNNTINAFSLTSSATLQGAGSTLVLISFDWSESAVSHHRLDAFGTVTIPFVTNGVTTVNGGNITLVGTSTATVSQQIDITASGQLVNDGTILLVDGQGSVVSSDGAGTFYNQSGSVIYSGGAGGSVAIGGNTALTFNTSGTLNADVGNINLNSTTPVQWLGGTWQANTGSVVAFTTLDIGGTAPKTLNGFSFNAFNDVNFTGDGDLDITGGAVFTISTGANVTHSSNAGILSSDGTGSFTGIQGVFTKTAGVTNVTAAYSVGQTDITGGALILSEAGNPNDTGIYNLSNGAALQVNTNRIFANTSYDFTGGVFRVDNGAMVVMNPNTGAVSSFGDLILAGNSTIAGNNTIEINGVFDWLSGAITSAGGLNILTTGVLNLSGAAAVGALFFNDGQVNVLNGGTLSLLNNGVLSGGFDIASGGAIDINNGSYSFGSGITGNGTLIIRGISSSVSLGQASTIGDLQLSGGVLSGASLTASGLSSWSGGNISSVVNFNGGLDITQSVVLDGAINVRGGSIDNNASVANGGSGVAAFNLDTGVFTVGATGTQTVDTGITMNNGAVLDVQGTLDVAASTAVGVTNNGGTIMGAGSIVGNVTNNGVIAPGNGIGALSINGDLLLQQNSIIAIEVAGADTASPGDQAGLQYDALNVTGTSTLAGELQVQVAQNASLNLQDTLLPVSAGSVAAGTAFVRVAPSPGYQFDLNSRLELVTLSVPNPVNIDPVGSDVVTLTNTIEGIEKVVSGDVDEVVQAPVLSDEDSEEDEGATLVCS